MLMTCEAIFLRRFSCALEDRVIFVPLKPLNSRLTTSGIITQLYDSKSKLIRRIFRSNVEVSSLIPQYVVSRGIYCLCHFILGHTFFFPETLDVDAECVICNVPFHYDLTTFSKIKSLTPQSKSERS